MSTFLFIHYIYNVQKKKKKKKKDKTNKKKYFFAITSFLSFKFSNFNCYQLVCFFKIVYQLS